MPERCEGIRSLTVADLILINKRLLTLQTPSEPFGVLQAGLLESAQMAPSFHRYYNQTEDIITLAAVLGMAIARNHAFMNANKRTAAVAVAMFMQLNGYELTAPGDELVYVFEAIVTGAVSQPEFENWLHYWSREVLSTSLNESDAFERLLANHRHTALDAD